MKMNKTTSSFLLAIPLVCFITWAPLYGLSLLNRGNRYTPSANYAGSQDSIYTEDGYYTDDYEAVVNWDLTDMSADEIVEEIKLVTETYETNDTFEDYLSRFDHTPCCIDGFQVSYSRNAESCNFDRIDNVDFPMQTNMDGSVTACKERDLCVTFTIQDYEKAEAVYDKLCEFIDSEEIDFVNDSYKDKHSTSWGYEVYTKQGGYIYLTMSGPDSYKFKFVKE